MEEQEIGGGTLPVPIEPEEEVGGLVRLALEKELPVEVLERLVALQERVSDRTARAEFFEALARFQSNMPEIRKTARAEIATKSGGRYGYTFAPLEEITRAIAQPLQAEGLSYSWTTEGVDGGFLNVVAILRHINGHEERAVFPVLMDTAAAMSGAQKGGAALTYGKRQSLTSVLGLTTADDDTDGAEPPKSGGKVSEDQLANLEALIEEVGADRKRLMAWAGVEALKDISEHDLPRIISILERRREGA